MRTIFRFMRNKRLFILLFGIILFIALMGTSLKRSRLTWPEKILGDAFGSMQSMLYRPVGAVADFFRDIDRLSDIYEENKRLRQMVAQHTEDQVRFDMLDAENSRLQKALDFTTEQKKMDNYHYSIAQIVGENMNPYERTVTINRGQKDGIRPGMTVRTVEGLVGFVDKVRHITSTVNLLTNVDPTTSHALSLSGTFLKKPDSFGVVEYDEQSKMLLMEKIEEKDRPDDGDTVVTSGLSNLSPKGIPIGIVQSSQVGDFGLTYTAVIKPFVNFGHLREVFVVATPEVNEE